MGLKSLGGIAALGLGAAFTGMAVVNRQRARREADRLMRESREPRCSHPSLTPRYRAQNGGDQDQATYYECDVCGRHFTPEEARRMDAPAAHA